MLRRRQERRKNKHFRRTDFADFEQEIFAGQTRPVSRLGRTGRLPPDVRLHDDGPDSSRAGTSSFWCQSYKAFSSSFQAYSSI
jgi:hypothetical protein